MFNNENISNLRNSDLQDIDFVINKNYKIN